MPDTNSRENSRDLILIWTISLMRALCLSLSGSCSLYPSPCLCLPRRRRHSQAAAAPSLCPPRKTNLSELPRSRRHSQAATPQPGLRLQRSWHNSTAIHGRWPMCQPKPVSTAEKPKQPGTSAKVGFLAFLASYPANSDSPKHQPKLASWPSSRQQLLPGSPSSLPCTPSAGWRKMLLAQTAAQNVQGRGESP